MTSLFDSKVYQHRNETPWASMSLSAFMREMMFRGKVTWTVQYRPSVVSRAWYTIEWTGEDGEQHRAESQEWDLCLWRAAQIELQICAKNETQEENKVTATTDQ
jgi:hypothetical protein